MQAKTISPVLTLAAKSVSLVICARISVIITVTVIIQTGVIRMSTRVILITQTINNEPIASNELYSQLQSSDTNEDHQANPTSSYQQHDHEYSVCEDSFKFSFDKAALVYNMSVYECY